MKIDGREIGRKFPPYIVAELSANHNGSIDRALETIKAAKDAGADAVKIQTYTADTMTLDCDNSDFIIDSGLWKGRSLYSLYKWAETPYEWHKEIFNYANEIGITCFSSPFDIDSVDFLESLDAPAYKIASFESSDILLLRAVAETKKPVIVSTGMATVSDMDLIVDTLEKYGCTNYALLKCTSSYPAEISDANLSAIPFMKEKYGCPIGLSDHTIGNVAPILSIGMGATIIEKHVCLDRSLGGVDSSFSLEPNELKHLVEDVNSAWLALGDGKISPANNEIKSMQFKRSLYFVDNLKKGDRITNKNIRSIRPGYGLPTINFDKIIGKEVCTDIPAGTATSWDLINE